MINTYQEQNLRITIIALLLLVGLTAIGAGYSFMVDPNGNAVGIPLGYLQHSGFSNFFYPGLILFSAIGIFGVLAALITLKRALLYPKIVQLYGLILIGWIGVQVILVRDFNLFHLCCIVIGLALVCSAMLSTKKKYW